jgi:hypothetical protein
MAKTNAERCREYYRAHRDKLLAQLREKREQDGDAVRARQRAKYAANKDKYAALAREYRRKNAAAIAARALAKYYANKEAINERRKGYRQKHYAKIYARIQRWRKENPEREFLYHAKRLLAEQTGLRFADIPDDLAEAKAEQIRLHRAAQGMETAL